MNKEVKIGLIAAGVIVLVLAGLAGLDYYNQQQNLIREKDPNLTQEERKIYEDRLAKANEALGNEALSDEERFSLLMNKGFQLYGLGKLAEARDSFVLASELQSEKVSVYVALYTVQMDMNDNEGAKNNIQKAIELDPASADIWKKYIILEKERFGVSNQALNDLWLEALTKTNNNVDIMTSYAVFLEDSANLQAAKEYWQKAIEANPNGKSLYEAEIKRLDAKLQQQN